jgi:hypothetical protein
MLSNSWVKYQIYYPRRLFLSETYLKITMNILELLTYFGVIVLRIVTDNFSANVKLFKIFCNGVK